MSEYEDDRVLYVENARDHCDGCLQDECGYVHQGQSGQTHDDGEFLGSGIHPLDTRDVRVGRRLDGSHSTR